VSLYDQSYGTSTYSYDELNRLTGEELAGYGAISYSYDAAGNRVALTTPSQQGGPGPALSMRNIYWASYQDWLDHELSIDYRITDQGPGTAFGSKVTNSTATNGVYLTTAMPMNLGEIGEGSFADFTLKYYIPSGVTSFQATVYSACADSGGESHYFPAKREFYSYNQANQLTELHDSDGETTSFTYNAAGALVRKTTGSGTTTYSYDGMDRLSQVQTPASTVDYAYDALGRRIQRSEGTDTVNYHLYKDTDLVDYRTDAQGTLTNATLRGAGGLISATDYTLPAPETGYYLFNPHGDTSAIADETGTLTSTYRYDAFGNELGGNSPAYGYTGKWERSYDSATETIQMGARDYDPSLGRFTSPDPLRGDLLDPQQRNRYPYTGNDPLTRYDLDGRETTVKWTWNGIRINVTTTTYSLEGEDAIASPMTGLSEDHGSSRNGADGSDAGECECAGVEKSELLPAEVNSYKFDKISDNQYLLILPSGEETIVSANNPYLWYYVKNIYTYQNVINWIGVGGLIMIPSAFSEPINPSIAYENKEIADTGESKISEFNASLEEDFIKARNWEEECGDQ